MTSGQQTRGLYPVGYLASQVMDAVLNLKSYTFDISAFKDPLDENLDIFGAMSSLNTGQLAALGIAIDPLASTSRIFVNGTMSRREDGTCNGVKFVFNHDLCYMEINFGDMVRRQVSSGNPASQLYYPRFTVLFFCSGYVFSNDVFLLDGAGTMFGGIDVGGSQGVIQDLNVVSGDGPPVGQPNVFGPGIQPGERFDSIEFVKQGNKLHVTGIVFEDLLKVRIGYIDTTFTVANDFLSVDVDIPTGVKPDPIVFQTTRYTYTTRTPFYP